MKKRRSNVELLKFKPLEQPKTSIIATLGGPDQFESEKDYLSNLIDSGMNIARINLSHIKNHNNPKSKSYGHIKNIVRNFKKLTEKKKRLVGLLFDICGPKIRVDVMDKPIEIKAGNELILEPTRSINEVYEYQVVPVTYDGFSQDVKKNHRILINDGKIELKVIKKNPILCKVLSCSVPLIETGNGINLPDSYVTEASLTMTDLETIQMLHKLKISQEIDFLGQSFVRDASDIRILENQRRTYIHTLDKRNKKIVMPGIIAKIETWQAVKKDKKGNFKVLDDIVAKSDGIMVARGDLAGETSSFEVPVIQSYLSKKGNEFGKAVIIATQMLSSMTNKGNTRPRRSEASDVANAVFDYVDAVMLSEETAKGELPFHCVETMRNIVLMAENSQNTKRKCIEMLSLATEGSIPSICRFDDQDTYTHQQAIAEAAIIFAENLKSPVIVVSTSSGDTAIKISKYRPLQPIIAFTDFEKSANRMLLHRGIYPFLLSSRPNNFEALIEVYKSILREVRIFDNKLIGDANGGKVFIPLTLGIQPDKHGSVAASGNTNTIYILDFS